MRQRTSNNYKLLVCYERQRCSGSIGRPKLSLRHSFWKECGPNNPSRMRDEEKTYFQGVRQVCEKETLRGTWGTFRELPVLPWSGIRVWMMRRWRGDGSRRNLDLGSLHGVIPVSPSRGLQINEGFPAHLVFNESILG